MDFAGRDLRIGWADAAGTLRILLWWAGRLIGHPAWGAPVILLLVPLAFALPGMPFLDLTVIFAVLFAVPLWLEGRAWRMRHG